MFSKCSNCGRVIERDGFRWIHENGVEYRHPVSPVYGLQLKRVDEVTGDLMPIRDWIESCKDGLLIDYDGFGLFSDGEYVLYAEDNEFNVIRPSDLEDPTFNRQNWPYMMWFNR